VTAQPAGDTRPRNTTPTSFMREPGEALWQFSQRVAAEMKSQPCTCDPGPEGQHQWFCGLNGDEIEEALAGRDADGGDT
jgi:hypothetical protein